MKMIIQFMAVNPVYELQRDEFLYLDQANHFAAGYICVPPLSACISTLIFPLGGSVFWIRFFPALFGALTMVIAWLMVEELEGKIYAKIMVSCALLFSVFVRLNILYQPNAFDILAWTALFYFLVRYVRTEKPVWLFCLMLVFVLGWYNKYTIAFLLAALLPAILLTNTRKILATRHFYLILLMGILLLLPNLIWQFSHGFPFIHHMAALKHTQLDNNSAAGFLKEQVMAFFGSLPLIVLSVVAFVRYKPFKPYRVIGISILLVLCLFTAFKAKNYYAFGLYPVLFVFGGVYLERVLTDNWKRILFPFLILVNLSLFISLRKLVLPVLTPTEIKARKVQFERLGLLRWNDGKNHQLPQDFADMQGWKEMADKALLAYKTIPESEKAQTLVFCDNYGQTGALNYYNRHKMPEAFSANTDYIFWLPRMKEIKNVLLVGDKPDDRIISMFTECKLTGTVTCEDAIEKGTGIFLLTGAGKDFTAEFYKMMEKRIAEFDIF
jgi:hypothetical protein